LSIADYCPEHRLKFIYKEKKVIALINKQFKNEAISDEAVSRLIDALRYFVEFIAGLRVDKTIAIATSGIRSAANKDIVLEQINNLLGINVTIITGCDEAKFVYEGVKNAVPMTKDTVLVVDIGGGSIEFIICNDGDGILSTYSFDIGVARLLNKYNFADPLSDSDIEVIKNILYADFETIIRKCTKQGVKTLIGTSGSFETFVNLVNRKISVKSFNESQKFVEINIEEFNIIHELLIKLSYKKRMKMPGMDIMRVKMIPIAAVITKYLIDTINIKKLIQSKYSIKEGIIFDCINKNLN
jgi:exopolyphosphatase/guanosine-5'-triphosphate,3'-diphosphate pyrophosphatase